MPCGAAWRRWPPRSASRNGDYAGQAAGVRRKINIPAMGSGPEQPKDWDAIRRERQEWLYPLRRIEPSWS